MPETLSTLAFSTNCKKVKNKIYLPFSKSSEKMGGSDEALVSQIEQLKAENSKL